MASIRKRGDKWHAQIRKQGHKPLTRSFSKKTDAELWAKKVESDIDRGIFLDLSEAQTTDLGEALDRYATEVLPSKRSQRTVISQIKVIKKAIGSHPLAKVTSSVISSYRDQRLKVVDPQTVRKDLSLLQRVFNTCIKDWGINLPHGNPVVQVRMPKQPQGRERRLEAGELDKLLAEFKRNQIMQAVVSFALETAMRREEITNMDWQDIDLKKRTLLIPKTKTDTPRRIPLSGKAVDVLQGIPRRIDGKVFDLRPDSVTQAFDRACKRAGIEDLRFHDLRHEATSRFFEKGLSIMEVASITGHKDLKMLRRYTHLKPEDLATKLG